MKWNQRGMKSVGWVILSCVLSGLSAGPIHAQAKSPTAEKSILSQGYFIRNVGQLPRNILFTAQIPGGRLVVRRHDLVVQMVEGEKSSPAYSGVTSRYPRQERGSLSGDDNFAVSQTPRRVSNVYVSFRGSTWDNVSAESPSEAKINILRGKNSAKWFRDISTYRAIRVRNLYPGIDLVLDADTHDGVPWRLEENGEEWTGEALRRVRLEVRTTASLEWGEEGLLVKKPY